MEKENKKGCSLCANILMTFYDFKHEQRNNKYCAMQQENGISIGRVSKSLQKTSHMALQSKEKKKERSHKTRYQVHEAEISRPKHKLRTQHK